MSEAEIPGDSNFEKKEHEKLKKKLKGLKKEEKKWNVKVIVVPVLVVAPSNLCMAHMNPTGKLLGEQETISSSYFWFLKHIFRKTSSGRAPAAAFCQVKTDQWCLWVVNYKEPVHDVTHAHRPYHLLHNGEQSKLAEQNKGKAPLGKAVTRLWSYLTCLQRASLWCHGNSSPTVTRPPENNCQMCSLTTLQATKKTQT